MKKIKFLDDVFGFSPIPIIGEIGMKNLLKQEHLKGFEYKDTWKNVARVRFGVYLSWTMIYLATDYISRSMR